MACKSEDKNYIRNICAGYDNQPDALLEILHEAQNGIGYLAKDTLTEIASVLNISRADIHGVVSFYDDFRCEPPQGATAKICVKICRAEACQAVGGEDLAKYAQKNPDVDIHNVYCLGNCALGPAVLVGDDLHGRVTPKKFDLVLKQMNRS